MRIAHDDTGSGPPVLFIHGFPHDRTLWTDQVAALQNVARCITADLRGLGESDSGEPYSIDQYADDMAALLAGLRVKSATVAGLSMGGYVALAMWRRHPQVVRAMILADTRPGADSDEGRRKRDEMIQLARSSGVRALADAQITGMLGKSTRERSPEIVARVHAMLAAAPLDGVVGALQAMRDRPDSTPLLGTITVPVLIAVGEEDVLTPPKESRLMQENIPGSALHVIAGAGHLSNVEQPAQFNALVGEFLKKTAGN
jgi:3-oxoadipate enol-lactonase